MLHIPLVLGAVDGRVQRQGRRLGLELRRPTTIGKIFTGQITKWNDPAIKALNPKANLPDEHIAVVHRSDGSGTTAVFTDFLTKTSPEWVSKLGGADKSFGKTVAWPVGIGGKGNDGVAALVSQTEGAIGYVELQYAIAEQAGLRQRQEQARHVHQALRLDDQRRGHQDVLPAGHADQPDLARWLADRVPDHGHDLRASSTRTRPTRPRPRRSSTSSAGR